MPNLVTPPTTRRRKGVTLRDVDRLVGVVEGRFAARNELGWPMQQATPVRVLMRELELPRLTVVALAAVAVHRREIVKRADGYVPATERPRLGLTPEGTTA